MKGYPLLLLTFLFIVPGATGQRHSFDFYDNPVNTVDLTTSDHDSLSQGKVPPVIKEYLQTNIRLYNLEDWAIVLFLKKYVEAQFPEMGNAEKVKTLSILLSYENINNAIGRRNKNRLLPLISIDKKIIATAYTFDEDGYRLITTDLEKEPFRIRDVEVVFYNGKDISLVAGTPEFKNTGYEHLTRSFFNYNTLQTDSIGFDYSRQYIKYSRDLPMVLSSRDFRKYALSQGFITSLVGGIDPRIRNCTSRWDSINFLLRFTQTIIKNEYNADTYGRNGYPSYPENTLMIGKGDCDDKSALLSFLLNYYFPGLDIVFLYYSSHVRLGVYDPGFDTAGRSSVEYKEKKYLIAETTDDFTELGDKFYLGARPPLQIIK